MEYRDLYDENRNLTGEKITKNQTVPKGKYYVTVMVFITNSNGEILLQKRSKQKGRLWATTGGHPTSGQNSLQGIQTEIFEELGINIKEDDLTLYKTIKTEDDFVDLYYLKQDIDIAKLKLQKEEVEDVKWFTQQEIKNLIIDNKKEPSISDQTENR